MPLLGLQGGRDVNGGVEVIDGCLQVEDRFGGQAGDGGGADVFDIADEPWGQWVVKVTAFVLSLRRPGRVVLDEGDGF